MKGEYFGKRESPEVNVHKESQGVYEKGRRPINVHDIERRPFENGDKEYTVCGVRRIKPNYGEINLSSW